MLTINFTDQGELDRAIQRLADSSNLTVREVVPAQMRLLAADLSKNTRPVNDDTAKAQKKIRGRIQAVYPSMGVVVSLLKKVNDGVAMRFEKLVKARRESDAATLLNQYLGTGVRYSVGAFDGGALHVAQAFSKHVTKALVCPASGAVNVRVEAYIKKVEKRVGFAKGGFAAAARDLGGVRGIPGYVTRQPSPGSGSIQEREDGITVSIQNDVTYIGAALDHAGEQRAIDFRAKQTGLVLQRMQDRRNAGAAPQHLG